jgi:hypothetical protein
MVKSVLIFGTLLMLWASPTLAQDLDDGGCVHNRQVYPDGYELCENGMLKRCDEGAWADIGRCDREATEAPRSEGGDDLEPEDRSPRR